MACGTLLDEKSTIHQKVAQIVSHPSIKLSNAVRLGKFLKLDRFTDLVYTVATCDIGRWRVVWPDFSFQKSNFFPYRFGVVELDQNPPPPPPPPEAAFSAPEVPGFRFHPSTLKLLLSISQAKGLLRWDCRAYTLHIAID